MVMAVTLSLYAPSLGNIDGVCVMSAISGV